MATEVAGDLSKAQKRELKWERKQANLKAAAEAAGEVYTAPSRESNSTDTPAEKIGKRKKRKLAALQQDSEAPASTSDIQATQTPAAAAEKKAKKKSKSSALSADAAASLRQAKAASSLPSALNRSSPDSDVLTLSAGIDTLIAALKPGRNSAEGTLSAESSTSSDMTKG